MKKTHALHEGDTIGIAAPASPFDRKRFVKGLKVLKKLGFRTYHRDDIFDQNRYLAGTDERRAEELTELFTNRNIKAIMFARGGYGSQRIIPLLDIDVILKHAKPVIGFSDLTALLTHLRQAADVPTFYGPVITQLGKDRCESTGEKLKLAISAKESSGEIQDENTKIIRDGIAKGPLVGGCLTLINSSIGTRYELKTDGSILFMEETGERVYVLDRMLTQLKNAGKLDGVSGIIFGSIVSPEDEKYDIEAMIKDTLSDFPGPIVMNFPAGHTDNFVTLPMGNELKLIADSESGIKIAYT